MAHPGLPAEIPPDFFSALALLMGKERLDLEALKLMVLLETAGQPLYEKIADGVDDPEAKDLLRKNAREETAHAHRLKNAIEILTGRPFEIPPLSENPYATPPELGEISPALLEGFVAGEIQGDQGYQRYADNEPDAAVARLLRQNGREETRHGERVTRVIAILREAKGG